MSHSEKDFKEFLIKAKEIDCLKDVVLASQDVEVPNAVYEIIKHLSLLFLEEKEKNLKLQQQLINQPINCQLLKEIVICNN